jgi:hypothetical protein
MIKMTGKERFLNVINGKETDRVPIFPLLMSFSAKRAGVSYRQFATNGLVLAQAQLNIIELFIGPAICTVAMIFSVVVIYSNAYNLWYNNTLATLLAIASGGIVYIIMLMLTGTMGYKELKKLLKNNI